MHPLIETRQPGQAQHTGTVGTGVREWLSTIAAAIKLILPPTLDTASPLVGHWSHFEIEHTGRRGHPLQSLHDRVLEHLPTARLKRG